MVHITYAFADLNELSSKDYVDLVRLWISVAAEKNPVHYNYLINSDKPYIDSVLRAGDMKDQIDEYKSRYKVILATAKPDNQSQESAETIGYLMGFEENLYTAKIQYACSRAVAFKEDLKPHKVGSNLVGLYLSNLRFEEPFPIESVAVDSHLESVGFWEKMGFEQNGHDIQQGELRTKGLHINEDGLHHWRQHKTPPAARR